MLVGLRRLQPGLAMASQQLLAAPSLRLLLDWRPGLSLQLQSLGQGLRLQLQWCWSHIQEWPSLRLRSRLFSWGQAPLCSPSTSQQLLLRWGAGHRESRLSLRMLLGQGLGPQLPWRLTQRRHSPRHVLMSRQGLGQRQGLLRRQGLPASAATQFLSP